MSDQEVVCEVYEPTSGSPVDHFPGCRAAPARHRSAMRAACGAAVAALALLALAVPAVGRRVDAASMVQRGKKATFSMRFGALKLDGMQVSKGSVKLIAKKLTKGEDDIVAFMETDTDPGPMGLWSQLRQRLEDKDDYDASQFDSSPLVEMTESRYYALSVFAKKKTKGPVLRVNPGVESCCQAGAKAGSAKGLLLRNVSVGENGLLLVVGFGFSPTDDEKAVQIAKLQDEIDRRTAAARQDGRILQVVAAGDINTRLVLPEDCESEEVELPSKKDISKNVTTRKISDDCMERVLLKLCGKTTRREMLDWDASRFEGVATDGRPYTPHAGLRSLSDMFYFMTDWWRQETKVPQMVTYKRKPWFDRMNSEFIDFLAAEHAYDEEEEETVPTGSADKLVLTSKELEKSLKHFIKERCKDPESGTKKSCKNDQVDLLEEAHMLTEMADHNDKGWLFNSDYFEEEGIDDLLRDSFFGMHDKVAKTKARSDEAQRYLNHDSEKRAIYMQTGWLDAIGMSKSGFAQAEFKDFDTELDIWAFDHTFVHARFKFRV